MGDEFEKEIEKASPPKGTGHLHWNYRKLKAFPPQLRTHGKSITDLYLKENLISEIPSWVGELRYLTELYLCGNHLTCVKNIGNLKSLTTLFISQNKIGEIPDSFTSLRSLVFLCADHNRISHLPNDIGTMELLMTLSVANNCLKYVPESIGHALNLRYLNLNHNKLHTLPPSLFTLPKLKFLSISQNPFAYFPLMRPLSQPQLIMSPAKSLKYVSFDVFSYIIEKEERFEYIEQFDMSLTTRNSNQFDESHIPMRKYSRVVVFRKGDEVKSRKVLKLPFSKLHQKEVGVLTLYELCLRFIHRKLKQKNGCKSIGDLSILPKTVISDIRAVPTAYCQTCKRELFQDTVLQIFDVTFNRAQIESVDRTKVILCTCSSFCSNLCDLNTMRKNITRSSVNFLEVDWVEES